MGSFSIVALTVGLLSVPANGLAQTQAEREMFNPRRYP
jgi:hypothetical protein